MTLPRRRFATRRLLIAAMAALAVLAAADTLLWFLATNRLEHELAAWQARRRAAGWTAAAGPPARSGWPLAAAIELPDLVLAGGRNALPGGLSWRAAHATLSVALLRPWRLNLRFAGQQVLRLASLPEFAFAADRFDLAIPLDAPWLKPGLAGRAADLSADGLRAALPSGELGIGALALHADTRPGAAPGEAALSVSGKAEAIDLPPLPGGRLWPPGPRIGSAWFDAALTGPLQGSGGLTARATAWRDAGGTLLVRHLGFGWGALGLSGSAAMGLDQHLQPSGAATTSLVGYDASLDALASSSALAARAVVAVKGVLAILARPPQDGGAPQVDLPVTLQDRTLTVGPFPLLRLPEWMWP
jgi:hypothetical protein